MAGGLRVKEGDYIADVTSASRSPSLAEGGALLLAVSWATMSRVNQSFNNLGQENLIPRVKDRDAKSL